MAASNFSLHARGTSDVGKVRSTNQDALLVDIDKGLFIVADGMGGHAGGEIASSICVETISSYIDHHKETIIHGDDVAILNLIESSIHKACSTIFSQALADHELKGMGTTATVLQIARGKAYIGQVGDSRLYLERCGFIFQITNDHSLVNEQVRIGRISEEEAENHQLRNIITRSVGYQEKELVDTFIFDINDSDQLLLCSDGLHGKMSNQEISQALKTKDIDSVHDLIDTANERGGEDNITVIVVKVSQDSKFSNDSLNEEKKS